MHAFRHTKRIGGYTMLCNSCGEVGKGREEAFRILEMLWRTLELRAKGIEAAARQTNILLTSSRLKFLN